MTGRSTTAPSGTPFSRLRSTFSSTAVGRFASLTSWAIILVVPPGSTASNGTAGNGEPGSRITLRTCCTVPSPPQTASTLTPCAASAASDAAVSPGAAGRSTAICGCVANKASSACVPDWLRPLRKFITTPSFGVAGVSALGLAGSIMLSGLQGANAGVALEEIEQGS